MTAEIEEAGQWADSAHVTVPVTKGLYFMYLPCIADQLLKLFLEFDGINNI